MATLARGEGSVLMCIPLSAAEGTGTNFSFFLFSQHLLEIGQLYCTNITFLVAGREEECLLLLLCCLLFLFSVADVLYLSELFHCVCSFHGRLCGTADSLASVAAQNKISEIVSISCGSTHIRECISGNKKIRHVIEVMCLHKGIHFPKYACLNC